MFSGYKTLVCALVVPILVVGCAYSKVRVQSSDNIYISATQTPLVAGLRRAVDDRPDADRKSDKNNDRPRDAVTSEQLYKHLKLSGVFKNVVFDRFSDEKVDVIITPKLKRFSSSESLNGMTAVAFGAAAIPIVGLVYMAAGGPTADQVAVVELELELKSKSAVKALSAQKTAAFTRRFGKDKTFQIGQLEGDALSDVLRELVAKTNVEVLDISQ